MERGVGVGGGRWGRGGVGGGVVEGGFGESGGVVEGRGGEGECRRRMKQAQECYNVL